jgi:hypothetical protein
MKISVVTMTPEWAGTILDNQNTNNRKLRPVVVARYTEAIMNGQWKLTQQGIAISKDGILLDGQHRLEAIRQADQPVQICLATDCDPEIFSVIDTGTARLASDMLQMEGISNATGIAAGIKLYILYNRYPVNVWTGPLKPSHSDIISFSRERRADVEFAAEISGSAYTECRKLRKSGIAAFILIGIDANVPREILKNFVKSLSSGAGLSSNSPILRLRAALVNGVIKNNGRGEHYSSQVFLAALIKAFNFEQDNIEIKLFKVPTVPPMPKIKALL